MNIRRVTISGADDHTDVGALKALRHEFPFVEWGILLSKNAPADRYPTIPWVSNLLRSDINVSFHLCGDYARWCMAGDMESVGRLIGRVSRVQINGFSGFHLPDLYAARLFPDVEFILQCSHNEAWDHAVSLRDRYRNVTMLWDPSGGEGRRFFETKYPSQASIEFGLAGGISDQNIDEALSHATKTQATWVDMESGVRTGNRFDLSKVRTVLSKCALLLDNKTLWVP